MDGTLIDSMMVWDKVIEEFLAARRVVYDGDIGGEVKNLSFPDSALYCIKKFGLKETSGQIIAEWKSMARRAYAETIVLKAGVHRILEHLRIKGIRLAVATTTDRDLVELVLRRHGILDFFEVIFTVQEVGVGKENPAFFQCVAEKLGVEPEMCLVVDDCLHAVDSAKRAGMKVWAVYDERSDYERPELERIADCYIKSLEEVDTKSIL
jgi:HAD superfamily hydrolase (TIGR01509 family)